MIRSSSPHHPGSTRLGFTLIELLVVITIMALLLTLIAIGTSGALLTSEAWWGNEWLEESHEAIASGMLLLIVAHVAGVIHASRSHGENLARAMITGVKTAAQPGDIA